MDKKTTIICSAPDLASMNIKENLLLMHDWEREGDVYESDRARIVEVDKLHIFCDHIDSKLERRGLPTNLIIFASKHKSDSSKRLFSAHFTGNVSDAKFGGNPRELAPAAPQLLRPVLHLMRDLAADADTGYDVSMESTHHGPTALSVPSIYIEIGSTEAEWVDQGAGSIVASAILDLDLNLDLNSDLNVDSNLDSNSNREPDGEVRKSGYPVAVGFGGGHYAHRQTKLIFETEITFGHNFPKYQLDNLDDGLIRDALLKSNADFAYFDRKSMNAAQRNHISAVIEDLGYEVLRERTIRERFAR